MALRRRKAARRRSASNGNGLPGWAWLITGALLALGAVLIAPQYLKPDSADGFFRPPAPVTPSANTAPPTSAPPPSQSATVPRAADTAAHTEPTPAPVVAQPDYDFYTVLPEPDSAHAADAAELAAPRTQTERARSQSAANAQRPEPAAAATPIRHADAATAPAPPATTAAKPVTAPTATATTATTASASSSAPTRTAATTPAGSSQATLLQAGAFLSPADAEALKARIALLGLQARVESSTVDGQSVYRVRLGPWASARELATAKQRLEEGGLPAREIRR